MAPTSLTLFAALLAFGTNVLAAPVANPQSGSTFTLGNPETTITFEPGAFGIPAKDSPEYPRWLWYYWLNKNKEQSEDDGLGDISSTISWSGKRSEPGSPPLCSSLAYNEGVACLSDPSTIYTSAEAPESKPEPEEPEWPEEEPPKGYPKPPTKKPHPSPPKYPSKPEPSKKPEPPKYPGHEEPAAGSITTSTYCTDAKLGVTWAC